LVNYDVNGVFVIILYPPNLKNGKLICRFWDQFGVVTAASVDDWADSLERVIANADPFSRQEVPRST